MKQNELKNITLEIVEKVRQAKSEGTYFSQPFQYCYIDNLLPEAFAKNIMDSFPPINSDTWESPKDDGIEIKHRTTWQSEFDIPDGVLPIIRILNSAPFLKAMAELFDIPKLIPDAYFAGGGLNITEKGGLLDVHVDGNYHDPTGLNRRINAILYLNPGWEKGWGGEFGIYDNKGENLVDSIAPLFNRLVMFDTHDKSFHGLPEPLNFPENQNRKSVILYYYTHASRTADKNTFAEPHSALWVKKGIKDKKGNTSREFS